MDLRQFRSDNSEATVSKTKRKGAPEKHSPRRLRLVGTYTENSVGTWFGSVKRNEQS